MNAEPLETGPDGTTPGVDLTTILMRDYLEKIGFFDQFVIGQETDKVFGVKGTVKDKGVSSAGPYVTIEYVSNTGSGSIVREVRITPDGARVNGRLIVGVETGEDGAVNLLYKHGDEVFPTPIKLPAISVKPSPAPVEVLAGKVDLGRALEDPTLKAKFEAIKGEIGVRSTKDFTDTGAYAMYGKTAEDFKQTYGKDKWETLRDYANDLSNSIVKEELENQGLKDIESKINKGVEPRHRKGPDIIVSTKDGVKLKVDIEFAGSGDELYSKQVNALMGKFAKGDADVGIIFCEGDYHIFVNPDTVYMPLKDIAQEAARRSSHSLKDFTGIAAIGGLGLLKGNFTDANGKAVSFTDDAGRWIGEFQNAYLDHAAVNGSAVFYSRLALSSVENSYLQNVRSAGSIIIGSTIIDSNVSAKLIVNSILQNTLSVCSTITNSVIDSCRILNSTLVSVVDSVRNYIEDSFGAYSAGISNCTIIRSKFMSAVNLSNSSIINSNLTAVANIDNMKIAHSDISYSANITRSEIADAKLAGCTVQDSRLLSCTATDSNFKNVNAANSKLTSTNAMNSNLFKVNAINSRLINANATNSNLLNTSTLLSNLMNVNATNSQLIRVSVASGIPRRGSSR